MPTISMFYGIVVYMFFFDNKRHPSPHLHVSYGDDDAVFTVSDGELQEGSIPTNKLRLVQAWIELRREDLLTDWRLVVHGQPPLPVKPLE